MCRLLEGVGLSARGGRDGVREHVGRVERPQRGYVLVMNRDMVIPTLLYVLLIAVGLITYIIVGLGHH